MNGRLLTLWHGTASGADDAALRSIAERGLVKDYSRPRQAGQEPGVYFSLSREYAMARALRCVGKLQRGGRPLLMGVETAINPHEWDWDFEVSHDSASAMIARIEAEKIAASPAAVGYDPDDYRYRVRLAEQTCLSFRRHGAANLYARHFNAAVNMLAPAADVALKYVGNTPLRVRTVEFI